MRIGKVKMSQLRQKRVLQEFVESEEMYKHLLKQNLSEDQLTDIIINSPVPLKKKLKWVTGKEKKDIEKALHSLEADDDGFLIWSLMERDEDNTIICYHGEPKELCEINFAIECEMMETGDYSHRFWSIAEKWMPYRDKDGNKRFYQEYVYLYLDFDPVYFKRDFFKSYKVNVVGESHKGQVKRLEHRYWGDVPIEGITVPFEDGNIVMADCEPFERKIKAIVTDKGKQLLFQDMSADGKWVKHLLDTKYGFDQYFSEIGCGASILNMKTNISPIYRMQKMTEFSEEDGELLKKRREMK